MYGRKTPSTSSHDVPGGNTLPVYTCVAVCPDCGKELYRVKHVPLDQRHVLLMELPKKALCENIEHNTFPEHNANFHFDLVWYREVYDGKGKETGLVKEESDNLFSIHECP